MVVVTALFVALDVAVDVEELDAEVLLTAEEDIHLPPQTPVLVSAAPIDDFM